MAIDLSDLFRCDRYLSTFPRGMPYRACLRRQLERQESTKPGKEGPPRSPFCAEKCELGRQNRAAMVGAGVALGTCHRCGGALIGPGNCPACVDRALEENRGPATGFLEGKRTEVSKVIWGEDGRGKGAPDAPIGPPPTQQKPHPFYSPEGEVGRPSGEPDSLLDEGEDLESAATALAPASPPLLQRDYEATLAIPRAEVEVALGETAQALLEANPAGRPTGAWHPFALHRDGDAAMALARMVGQALQPAPAHPAPANPSTPAPQPAEEDTMACPECGSKTAHPKWCSRRPGGAVPGAVRHDPVSHKPVKARQPARVKAVPSIAKKSEVPEVRLARPMSRLSVDELVADRGVAEETIERVRKEQTERIQAIDDELRRRREEIRKALGEGEAERATG